MYLLVLPSYRVYIKYIIPSAERQSCAKYTNIHAPQSGTGDGSGCVLWVQCFCHPQTHSHPSYTDTIHNLHRIYIFKYSYLIWHIISLPRGNNGVNGINELIGVGTIFTLALKFFLLLLTFGCAVANRLNVKRFKLLR